MFSKIKYSLFSILVFSTLIFSQDVILSIDGQDLLYDSSIDIYGFQFDHDGCASGSNGGAAAANGFTVSTGNNTVLGF